MQLSRACVLLVLLWMPLGCGPTRPPPPEPRVAFLALQAAPTSGQFVTRLDIKADVSNPTPEALTGVHVEVALVDGPRFTLEFGDLRPRREGSAWLPAHLPRGVMPEGMFGGTQVIERPEAATLSKVWQLTQVEEVVLGYKRGGELVRRDLTQAVRAALPGWVEAESKVARQLDARSQEPQPVTTSAN